MHRRGPIRVLVVDDDDDDRLLTKACLEDVAGVEYVVEEAATSRDGMANMVQCRHDVVLLDWHLGDRDGLALFQEARDAGCCVPVIMLTGDGDRDLDMAAMVAGAADFLSKSAMTPALLERSIRYAINQAATLRALEARTEELARSNRELEQFTAIVGHDLRGPMHAIAAYAELLERRYSGRLDDSADQMIARMISGVGRLDKLITDLLVYARVNGPAITDGEADCDACLDAALADLDTAIVRASASVTREPLPTVPGNATLLTQVFANLVGNAIKFKFGRPPVVHISATDLPNGGWAIEVRDKGAGIPSEDLERVFVIFQRGRGRNEIAGTGVGLAICKKIVERHGGVLSVQSEVRKGTTFRFTLPGSAAG
jgi:signal transduction histidine kinase